MPSEILDEFFRIARKSMDDVSYKNKALMLKLLTTQADKEIEICNATLREHNGKSVIFPPGIFERLKSATDIIATEHERLKIIKLKEDARKLLLGDSDNELAKDNGASQMKIFISHSEKDQAIAKVLVDYLLASLKFSDDQEVRASSVEGHGFKFGNLDGNIKDDLNIAPYVIVLITKESLRSYWVMIEVGAAWALSKTMIPIISPEIKFDELHDVIKNSHCILISNTKVSEKLSDMVNEIHNTLNIQLKGGGKSQSKLDEFVSLFRAYKSDRKIEEPVEEPVSEDTKPIINSADGKQSGFEKCSLILRSIWKLDANHSTYSNNGYNVKTISEDSGISIPLCEDYLDSLVEKQYIKKDKYLSPPGNHYKLEKKGREFLRVKYPELNT